MSIEIPEAIVTHECSDCINFCQHYRRAYNGYRPINYFHCGKTRKKDFKLCDKHQKVNKETINKSLKEKTNDLINRLNDMLDLF